MIALRCGWLLCWLSVPGLARAHGSEYVYARLVLGDRPRLEVSLEYNDNPIVESREQARSILEKDLVLQGARLRSDVAGLSRHATWSEGGVFPASAPVPVPDPAEGLDHRLLTVSLELSGQLRGPFRLTVRPGSEQAVIYWIDEPRPDGRETRWQILIAGDTSEEVAIPAVADAGPLSLAFVGCAGMAWFVVARLRKGARTPD